MPHKRELFPRALIIGGALSLLLSGCADETPIVQITNISGERIYLSNNPDSLNLETRTGSLAPGERAVATCVDVTEGHPDSTSVRVTGEGGKTGYVATDTPYDRYGNGGEPQISPGHTELATQLAAC